MIQPTPLRKNDTIVIVSTARKISSSELEPAIEWLHESGFQVELSPYLFEVENQFAGSDETRRKSLQWALDHPTAKAIWCARGGYGTARILDDLDWTQFTIKPKWITGYSDITALHGSLQTKGYASIHATMPINVATNTKEALDSLYLAWTHTPSTLEAEAHPLNQIGSAKGILVGGNLSVLYSTLGSPSQPPLGNCILFLEDLDEYLYHIDRMMVNLSRNGWWEKVSGVVVGGMTDMNDNTIPFGSSAVETLARHIAPYNIPLGFNFSAGHIDDNEALILGSTYSLLVGKSGSILRPE